MPVDHFACGGDTYRPHRIFCIGKNYPEHIRELQGTPPDRPVVFLKPPSCLVAPGETVQRPLHGQELHHEVEVVVLLGGAGHHLEPAAARGLIAGLTLGIDLTLRDVQRDLKQKGLPWEAAKAFEQSAPLGEFSPPAADLDLAGITFQCAVNGEVKQRGCTGDMLHSIPELIAWLSGIWHLTAGDVLFTGTPAGVGPIPPQTTLTAESPQLGRWQWRVD